MAALLNILVDFFDDFLDCRNRILLDLVISGF